MWGAALAGCAFFFTGDVRDYVLVAIMVFGPLTDGRWSLPQRPASRLPLWWTLAIAAAIAVMIASGWVGWDFALSSIVIVALPEEWFFRGYVMKRVGDGWPANIAASVLFAALHVVTRGPLVGLKVFMPSLAFGWLYQRSRYLPLVIMVHGISNIVYHVYLAQALARLIGSIPV